MLNHKPMNQLNGFHGDGNRANAGKHCQATRRAGSASLNIHYFFIFFSIFPVFCHFFFYLFPYHFKSCTLKVYFSYELLPSLSARQVRGHGGV